jgi:hypothetical protein
MAFTNEDFPDRLFESIDEFERARTEKKATSSFQGGIVAKIIPASKTILEKTVLDLQTKIDDIFREIQRMQEELSISPSKPKENKEGLLVGTALYGESRGRRYTIEVLEEDYLCSDGQVYDSLSGAALGVSGNRRSGWKFWKDIHGTPIGDITGRFDKNARNSLV